ncbi:MAG: PKD domain-containing protein [Acidobacteriota bacterium]
MAGLPTVAGFTSSLNFPVVNPLQPSCGSCGPSQSDAFVAKLLPDASAIVFSTYLGGSDIDVANGIAVDADGDIYVVGRTESDDFPVRNPFQASRGGRADAFLAKIAGNGSAIIYATYLGGSEDDNAEAVAVSSGESAHVVGSTASSDFPVASALQPANAGGQDGFVVKFQSTGTALIYGTYLGGPGLDVAHGVALDGARHVYVAGRLNGIDLMRINQVGTQVVYQVMLPGPASDGRAVALDAQGDAYLVGTVATCLPVSRDAMIAKIDPSGTTIFTKQMTPCTQGDVKGLAVIPDGNGGAILAGVTTSRAFETCPVQSYLGGLAENAFVASVDSQGELRPLTQTLGGGNVEIAYGLASDGQGGVWLAGETCSPDMPVRLPLQPNLANAAGRPDGFLARLQEPAATVPVADFAAANRTGAPPLVVDFDDASSCRVDGWLWDFGDGTTSAQRNPTHTFAQDGSYAITLTATSPAGSSALTRADYVTVGTPVVADFDATPTDGLVPLAVQFQSRCTGSVTSYLWDFGDGQTSSLQNPSHTYTAPGKFSVSLVAQGPVSRNTEYKDGFVSAHEVIPAADVSPRVVRTGARVTFKDVSQGAVQSVLWDFGDASSSSAGITTHTYVVPGYYTIGLQVAGPTSTEELMLSDHVLVCDLAAVSVVAAPGPDPIAPPRIAAFDVMGLPSAGVDTYAYGTFGYGVNVGKGDIEGGPLDEIITGPGPGPTFGPQVRAFRRALGPIPKVDFYAYATLRYGAGVAGASLDADAFEEIETGAGPGAPFGPHVRAFNFDNVGVSAIPSINFFAYQTLRYGVVDKGDVDGLAGDEIVTSPGPGPTFGPSCEASWSSPLSSPCPQSTSSRS